MNQQPTVSSIIIIFNGEEFLEEAIESVFLQTYENWELLLCDDGSSDGSTEIAKRYARKFPDKVRYLDHNNHQNKGMSATRCLGLRHAKGQYIAWLDADDAWLPQKLERQVSIIEQWPEVAMVYGPLQIWFSWTGRYDDFRRDFIQDVGVCPDTLIQPPRLVNRFLENAMYLPAGVLVRRSVLEEIDAYQKPIDDEVEDEINNFKICLQWPVFVSSESWYRYRQHQKSYSANPNRPGGSRESRLIYYEGLAEYLQRFGSENDDVSQAVGRQIRRYSPSICNKISDVTGWVVETARHSFGKGMRFARRVATYMLPQSLRSWLGLLLYDRKTSPPPGWLHLGNLRRVTPINRAFGCGRGKPCDRYYIGKFLEANSPDIRGRVLEIGDSTYTSKYGHGKVTYSDVLHALPGNRCATLVADLATGEGVPANAFDCMILTQKLPFIYDFKAAIRNAVGALKPGGVMLVTLPGISQINRFAADRWGDYWRFTSYSITKIFEEYFDAHQVTVKVYGNVLTAVALLHGIAWEELSGEELNHCDPDYELIIAVRAVKGSHDGRDEL